MPAAIGARLVTAALAGAMAAIHLHLWSGGYRHLHVIGILFLLNGIGGILLGVALLVVPTRWLGGVAALAALFTLGTLIGLILSLTTGLFGFKEFTGAPYVVETLWLESIGILLSALLAAAYAQATVSSLHTVRPRMPLRQVRH